MRFAGYGVVWSEKRNRALVDFENGLEGPGVVEITEQATIDEMLALGYEEFKGSVDSIKSGEAVYVAKPKRTTKKGA